MRLAVVSVEAADLERLQQLLDQVRSQLTRPWLWAASEGDADVLVIDVDSLYGHMDWLRAHGQGRRVICLTGRPGNEHDVTLTRPISAQGLLHALRHFEQAARAALEGAAANLAPAAPDPAPEAPVESPTADAAPVAAAPEPPTPAPESLPAPVAFAPARLTPRATPIVKPKPDVAAADSAVAAGPDRLTLADFCTQAALPEPARLERAGMAVLIVDAARDQYFASSATLKPLLGYCSGTIARSEWQPVDGAELEAARAAGMLPLSRLVWLHTLINSHGHLLDGLDVNARFRLTRWPQIEREFPRHFRIATVMMKGPATLTEIGDQSGSSIADVADFVNAYATLGIVEPEGGQTAVAAPSGAGEAAGGGLLARLRGLRRG
jgi:hypothetical protein